jgi:acetoacetate decarboxylase
MLSRGRWEPLEVDPSGHVLAWIGDMGQPSHTIDHYHEGLTAIRVRYQQWSGWYINYIWVDHDMALTFAREIYGWPANLCESTALRFHGSQIFGDCVRYGEPLMRMSINITSPPPVGRSQPLEDAFADLAGGDFLQIRKFPAANQDGHPIKQLLLIPSQDFKIHEIWSGNGVLELGKSGLYPHLHKLDPHEMLGAWYIKASWVVPHPRLLWQS